MFFALFFLLQPLHHEPSSEPPSMTGSRLGFGSQFEHHRSRLGFGGTIRDSGGGRVVAAGKQAVHVPGERRRSGWCCSGHPYQWRGRSLTAVCDSGRRRLRVAIQPYIFLASLAAWEMEEEVESQEVIEEKGDEREEVESSGAGGGFLEAIAAMLLHS